MVKQCLLILLTALAASCNAASIDVSAEVRQDGAYENQPLTGTVTVTHPRDVPVDINSFLLGKDKLTVDFVKDVRISPNDPTVLSIYNFQLPGQPEGLYALPPISVRVGDKVYRSFMSSYSVSPRPAGMSTPAPQAPSMPRTQRSSAPAGTYQLRLEAGVDGKSALYPGQTTIFFYKYSYSGDIKLSVEKVPLLDAEGFIKIGEKEFKNYEDNGLSVTQISQKVQAVKPGKYSFGPSQIEGVAYKTDSLGNPVFVSQKLESEAPVLEITVLPFPENTKPASFNGAVGKFTFQTQLLSTPKVEVGDDLTLGLTISGKGNLTNVTIPDLCCQPGMSGFLKQGDLPPKEVISGDVKTVTVKMRVLSDKLKQIPSIEFSFFDPEQSDYVTLHSDPIPIEVAAVPTPKLPTISPETKKESPTTTPKLVSPTPAPIEIESIMPLTSQDLYNLRFGSWWALIVLPLAAALLAFQWHLKSYMAWRSSQVIPITSLELLNKAFAKKDSPNFEALKNALTLALNEASIPPSDLLTGEVKNLLSSIDEKRFGSKESIDIKQLKVQSEALYAKIKERGHVAKA